MRACVCLRAHTHEQARLEHERQEQARQSLERAKVRATKDLEDLDNTIVQNEHEKLDESVVDEKLDTLSTGIIELYEKEMRSLPCEFLKLDAPNLETWLKENIQTLKNRMSITVAMGKAKTFVDEKIDALPSALPSALNEIKAPAATKKLEQMLGPETR